MQAGNFFAPTGAQGEAKALHCLQQHCNMPKDIGIFNFQEVQDIKDIQLRDIGG